MSYIRSGSNPESLYIFTCDNNEWYWTDTNGNQQFMSMPHEVFIQICKLWDDCYDEDIGIEYKGVVVKEVIVLQKTGEVKKHGSIGFLEALGKLNKQNPEQKEIDKLWEDTAQDFKIMVEYKDKRCIMWNVTWNRVVDNVMNYERISKWYRRLWSNIKFLYWDMEELIRKITDTEENHPNYT